MLLRVQLFAVLHVTLGLCGTKHNALRRQQEIGGLWVLLERREPAARSDSNELLQSMHSAGYAFDTCLSCGTEGRLLVLFWSGSGLGY